MIFLQFENLGLQMDSTRCRPKSAAVKFKQIVLSFLARLLLDSRVLLWLIRLAFYLKVTKFPRKPTSS